MIFYFVTKELVTGSLLQRFVDGYDEFRNSRLKLIPSVPKVLSTFSKYYSNSVLCFFVLFDIYIFWACSFNTVSCRLHGWCAGLLEAPLIS
ncbi:hypothetical protein PVL29_002474 [Vitis rotundifolia]|uniref:Protein ENHANCED DISEASE RESISTANCE 2 C-terminal domain-containing protein n=1 Tax=Vitis rotundifolia TaxID=103349 RepID=A0AA39AI28_VITRO|nr:hypothetical protein PVL29_002474 [Vitis rotundifolia]